MLTLHLDLGREMRGGQWQVLTLLRTLGEEAVLLARKDAPLIERARQEGLRAEPFSALALRRWQQRASLVHAHDAKSHLWTALLHSPRTVVSRRVGFPVKDSF